MIIKLPAAYDTSYYEIIPDFARVNPRPLFVATKATEGTTHRDAKFLTYWADLKQDEIKRGAYHFHRKAYAAAPQATNFLSALQAGGVNRDDVFVLDIEEGGETATQIIAWIDIVEASYPNNLIMIYSRKNILDPITMTSTQAARLRTYPIWTAGYPANPDLFNTVPDYYVPNPLKWGPVWMWQYSESAIVTGITGEVDANWLAPVFQVILGATPPPSDVTSTPHDGMKRVSGIRHGWKFELFITDPVKVDYESVCLSPLETPSSVARRKGATLAVNGGEWDRVSRVKDYTVFNGSTCQTRVTAVPSLMVLGDNSIRIAHTAVSNVKQALSGLRYIVQNGVIPVYLFGTEPQYTEGHARSIHGVTADGFHMVLQSEGVYPNQGLTLKQCAEIMLQYGAVTAFDSGGGGDVACILDGQSLIIPENIYNGAHFERALPNVFLIYARTETPMANGTANEKLGNTSTVRKKPSRYGDSLYVLPVDSTIEFVAVVPVIVGGTADNVTDEWFDLTGDPANPKFVNYKLNGTYYYTIITQPTTPPPPVTNAPASIDINLVAGSTVTIKDAAGNVLWSGTA